jgi:hypothetical protein
MPEPLRASRLNPANSYVRRAWENLAEIRWVLKDSAGIDLPAPARKTIDLEGRIVKDGVRKALRDRQLALTELVHAIRECRTIAKSKPLTLQGSDYAHAVQELNRAIDWAEGLPFRWWRRNRLGSQIAFSKREPTDLVPIPAPRSFPDSK